MSLAASNFAKFLKKITEQTNYSLEKTTVIDEASISLSSKEQNIQMIIFNILQPQSTIQILMTII